MNSYTYRDARRQLLSEALAALPPEQEDLRPALQTEQQALQGQDWTLTDRTYLAVTAEWLWSTRLSLQQEVNQDPALLALGRTTALTQAQAAAIESIPHGPAGPPPDYLDQVRAAINEDEAVFGELLQAGHRRWVVLAEAERPYPFDDVGVLLPLRLETLFDGPNTPRNEDAAAWKLSLRVIPDEASVCRDDPYVSEAERRLLLAFWQAVQQPGPLQDTWLEGDAAQLAWIQLCDQVTAPRAAWLVATIGVVPAGESLALELPADMPAAPQPNRVGGLPPELQVFALTTDPLLGATHLALGRLPQDKEKQIDASALLLGLPASLEQEKNSWWASWEKAKAVGLGGEWLLPAGLTPQTLQALYVVGIGEEAPQAHFRAQIDAGELSILRLGSPTNTVRGQAAAEGGARSTDWRKVAQLRLRQRLNPQQNAAAQAARNLQYYLTGNDQALPFFPGADAPDDTWESQLLVGALWPALWGHWLRDIWQEGDDAHRAGLWALANLCPEGPLMPLRIGDQPYGLLPVTALSAWETEAAYLPEIQARRQVEKALAAALPDWVRQWAGAVAGKRSVVGKTAFDFMALLGQDAHSHRYLWRQFVPAWALIAGYGLDPLTQQEFMDRARGTYRVVSQRYGRELAVPYLAGSYAFANNLPLVQPTRMIFRHQNQTRRERLALPDFLALLFGSAGEEDPQQNDLEAFFRRWRVWPDYGDYQLSTLPDSLLIRLLIYASQVTLQWGRSPDGSPAQQELRDIQQHMARQLAQELDQQAWQSQEPDPFTPQEPVFTLRLPAERRQQWERALRATLDSAAHRIDPWVTGFAWQRLRRQSSSPWHAHRLGAYGWVEGPFSGQPGPTEAGRLHTPSYNQTLAALILRDKFLSSRRSAVLNQNGDNPWQMDISSAKVRLAEEIADEVRLGFPIQEIVGRQVEHIIGHPQVVRNLRRSSKYAMYPERQDPNEVCNGLEALRGLLMGDADFPLDSSQQASLQLVSEALDTYGDLLLADGVLQLVNRQVDRGAETMEAAAGFSRPPSLDFIRTPPSGYQLESVVVSALPFVAVQDLGEAASPGRQADPSVAAFLESQLGTDWTWSVSNADNELPLGEVTLARLGLAPIDTLALSEDFLQQLVRRQLDLPLVYISEGHNRAWKAGDAQGNFLGQVTLVELNLAPETLATLDDATLHQRVRTTLGLGPDAVVGEVLPADLRLWLARDEFSTLLGMANLATLGLTAAEAGKLELPALHRLIRLQLGLARVRVDSPRQHRLAQQLVAALGSRPAAGRDFGLEEAATYIAIYEELRDRYTLLYQAAENQVAALRAAADNTTRAQALRQALTWGLIPLRDLQETQMADQTQYLGALLGLEMPETDTLLAALAEKAAETLAGRLALAPLPADLAPGARIGTPLPDQELRKQNNVPDGIPSLAQAIASLAAPSARLAVLACWPREALANHTGVDTSQPDATLEETWLTVVAPTRANLARLEALQLEMNPPLTSWTNFPGDPWRTGAGNVVQQNLQQRSTAAAPQMLFPRFIAAYGSAGAWQGNQVAVGLIDAFSEALPMPQRSTATAFGFNAPAARAPQAILLAVPPKLRQRLNPEGLLQILEETRALTRARTARPEDLGEYQALTSTWFQSSGTARFWPEPGPLFVY